MKKILAFIFLVSIHLVADDIDFDAAFSSTNDDTKKEKKVRSESLNIKEAEVLSKDQELPSSILKKVTTKWLSSVSKSNPKDLRSQCATLVNDYNAWSACMKHEDVLFANNLKAYYVLKRKCNYLAGIDNSGMSYVCKKENQYSCSALKASQEVINTCVTCNGSNLWLRVYATGKVLRCY